MSETLRRATTAVFFVCLSAFCVLQLVVFEPTVVLLAGVIAYVVLGSFVAYFAVLSLERAQQQKSALSVKLTGQKMSEEECTNALSQYNTCFVSLVSLERCGLAAVPPILTTQFANLSSLNLRDNAIVNIDCLCQISTLRMLNLSKNRLRVLPVDVDRLRRLQYVNLCENPLPDAFAVVQSGAKVVQLLLREAAEFFCRAPRARLAVVCLMAVKKFSPPDGVFRRVPRDVVLIVARMLHESRHDPVWTLRGKRKVIGM